MIWYGLDLRWAYADLLPGIYRNTRCRHTAYDILHDALLRFALTKDHDRIERPHAYLRTVVRNVLADNYREMARFVPLASDEIETSESGFTAETMPEQFLAPSPEHLADLQQRLHALQRIIDCLPPRCREVFWLFRIDGHSQVEIASRLGISLNMVERHIMRALIDLRAGRELLAN
ncbi:MAG: sigma-70 family RNA polymerase sigma factor [Nitrosomonadales bacterium]|nr:sigma-70 family RNA polymerase sigma factor [Nitrosomonadales bacterium]